MKSIFRRFILITFVIFVNNLFCQISDKIEFNCGEGDYKYTKLGQITKEEATQKAIENAKMQAIKKRYGTNIGKDSDLIKFEGNEKFYLYTTAGIAVEWVDDVNIEIKEKISGADIILTAYICGYMRMEEKIETIEIVEKIEAVEVEEVVEAVEAIEAIEPVEVVKVEVVEVIEPIEVVKVVETEPVEVVETIKGTDLKIMPLRNGISEQFSDTRFKNEDDLYLLFKSPVDGYLAIYLSDEKTTDCLLPYSNNIGNFTIKAGEEYILFSEKNAKNNEDKTQIKEYVLLTDKKVEKNMLYVLFSKKQFVNTNFLPTQLSNSDFSIWLKDLQQQDSNLQIEEIKLIITNK